MKRFLDTNILVYAQTTDARKDRAINLIAEGGVISVQVLNELTNVLRRKLLRDWPETLQVLADIRTLLDPPLPITLADHDAALVITREHGLSISDAMIVAVASNSGCEQLMTEDLQHGRKFGPLTVVNPFV